VSVGSVTVASPPFAGTPVCNQPGHKSQLSKGMETVTPLSPSP